MNELSLRVDDRAGSGHALQSNILGWADLSAGRLLRSSRALRRNDSSRNGYHRVSQDERFMAHALELAERGRGFVSPNPMVGACIVKYGRLIGQGYHACFGSAHAEIMALRQSGGLVRGATMYVTLEPCSTYGKTPPCVEAIREAKIKRVVIATMDPNPSHAGRGRTILKRYGIQVTTGVLRRAAEVQIEAYSKWMRTGVPFVILKMAQSLDGKIASRTGESKWISGSRARKWVHDLRASCDAVLVGRNTVAADDPLLTVRNGKCRKSPWRIILDRSGTCSPKARVFGEGAPTILACSERLMDEAARKFRRTKVTFCPLKVNQGRLDLAALLRCLGSIGITSLLVEGGGEVAWSFIDGRLVDKLVWIVAPKIVGGRDAKTSVEGLGFEAISEAARVRMIRMVLVGEDLVFEGRLDSTCFRESLNVKQG